MKKEEISQTNATVLQPEDLMHNFKEPRQSCKHCYGSGKEGWRQDGSPVLCRCLTRKNGNMIKFSQFQEICNNRRNKNDDDTGSN